MSKRGSQAPAPILSPWRGCGGGEVGCCRYLLSDKVRAAPACCGLPARAGLWGSAGSPCCAGGDVPASRPLCSSREREKRLRRVTSSTHRDLELGILLSRDRAHANDAGNCTALIKLLNSRSPAACKQGREGASCPSHGSCSPRQPPTATYSFLASHLAPRAFARTSVPYTSPPSSPSLGAGSWPHVPNWG